MKMLYTKRFSKDIDNIGHDLKLKKRVLKLLEQLKQIESLDELGDVRKIQGYDTYYRIRVGDHRLGMKFSKDCIEMLRFLHRKDIYRHFP